jgi:hypothetical protein
MPRSTVRTLATIALIALLSVTALGCSATDPDTGEGAPRNGTSPTPDITELDDGRVRVEGWLVRVDLEGGFYAIAKASPTPDTGSAPETLIVIANADAFARELERMTGEYVRAGGTRLDGASIRMAGPEMQLEEIEVLDSE